MSLSIEQWEDINNIDNRNIKSKFKLITQGFKINFDAPKNDNKSINLHFQTESVPFPLKTCFFYYNLKKIIGILSSNMHILEEDIKTDCTLGLNCTCKPTITTKNRTTCEKAIIFKDF